MLLTLSDHPHTGVSRETGTLCHIELVDGNQDALGRAGEQVVEIKALSDVLLGDLMCQADIGLNQLRAGVCVGGRLSVLNQLDLLVFSEDDGSSGEGSEEIQHVAVPLLCWVYYLDE